MNKETLRNMRNIVISPGIIGLASALGGGLDMVIGLETMSNTEERKHPSISSPIEIEQARKEILVFDNKVRNLVIAGKAPVDIAEIPAADDTSGVKKSIELVRQKEEILQQRNRLHEQLLNKRLLRSRIDAGGMLGAIALFIINDFIIHRPKFQSTIKKQK